MTQQNYQLKNNFDLKINGGPKIFLDPESKYCWPKQLLTNFLLNSKFIGSKHWLVHKECWVTTKCSGEKIWIKKIKKIFCQNDFGSTNFGSKKEFGSNKILGPNCFGVHNYVGSNVDIICFVYFMILHDFCINEIITCHNERCNVAQISEKI